MGGGGGGDGGGGGWWRRRWWWRVGWGEGWSPNHREKGCSNPTPANREIHTNQPGSYYFNPGSVIKNRKLIEGILYYHQLNQMRAVNLEGNGAFLADLTFLEAGDFVADADGVPTIKDFSVGVLHGGEFCCCCLVSEEVFLNPPGSEVLNLRDETTSGSRSTSDTRTTWGDPDINCNQSPVRNCLSHDVTNNSGGNEYNVRGKQLPTLMIV